MNNKILGNAGESIAKKYLIKNGYNILDCNFRIRNGEIDIIASKNKCLSFIEVKTRKSLRYGYPRDAVNYIKQKRIINAANVYIMKNHLEDINVSFDVIEIILNSFNKVNHLSFIRNAFSI